MLLETPDLRDSSQAFAAKLASDTGAITWTKILGSSGGNDYGNGIGANVESVFVVGTSSATWAATNPNLSEPIRAFSGSPDAFVAKLDSSSGNLLDNTFLGGAGADQGNAIALDDNYVYVVGNSTATWGNPKQAFSGSSDAFVAKLEQNYLALKWNTFLGGSAVGTGITIGEDNKNYNELIYVCGYSSATWGSPTLSFTASKDAFAAQLDTSGNIVWNTFVAGSSDTEGTGISANSNGEFTMTGYSSDPVAFVANLSEYTHRHRLSPLRSMTQLPPSVVRRYRVLVLYSVSTTTSQPPVTADATTGAWTVSGLTLARDDSISVTAQVPGAEVSSEATATVVAAPPAPTVTTINPTSGTTAGGTTVTVTGSGFWGGGSSSVVSEVNFGTTAGTVLNVTSDDSLTINAPAGSGPVDVTVVTPGGTSDTSVADTYTYVAPPTATPIPANGVTGVALTAPVSALFNQAVSTVDLSGVTISPDPGGVSATLNGDGVTVNIAHNNFINSETYTVTIPAGTVKNSDNVTNAQVQWYFNSITSAPTPTLLTPLNDQTGVAPDATVSASFNEDISAVSTTSLAGVTIKPDPGDVVATMTNAATIGIAHAAFANGTVYTVDIPANTVQSADSVTNADVTWSFTTVTAAPTATPTPANGVTGVALTAAVSALFNQTVSTVNLSGVTISPDPGGVSATLNGDGVTVNIAHNNFANGTPYTVTIPAGAVKNGDNVSNAVVSWSFTTVTAAPTATPTPANGVTGVALTAAVSALFNQTVSTVNLSGVTISPDPGGVSATLNGDGVTVNIAHNNFANSTPYTVTIPAGAVKNGDSVSNAVVSWSFTTVTTAPTATPTPANSVTGVALTAPVSALFNQTVSTVNLSGVTISPDPGGVSATLNGDGVTVNIAHNNFANGTPYTVTIPAGAVKNGDSVSNAVVSWSFTTVTAAPTATPTPANSVTGVALTAPVSALFNQTVSTVNLSGVTISPDPGGVSATLNGDGVTVNIAHNNFANGTPYTVTIPAGAVKNGDSVSNAVVSWSFTTVTAAPTATPATITIDASTLSQTYGLTEAITATTGPTGLSYSATYTGISPTVYATSATPPTNAGSYTVVATITDPNYTPATDSETLVIAPAPLTITATDEIKICGTAFTFYGTEFTPSGLINGDKVTSVTLSSAGALSSAPVGTYAIVPSAAVGTGLSNYTIIYVNGTMTVIPPPNGKSPIIILSSHPNPSNYGQSVTFNVAVFGGFKNSIPTGLVTFKNGTAVLGTGKLDKSGFTSITTSALPVGKDTITATYSGDSVYTGGTSFRAVVELVQYNTTITLSSKPNPSTSGGAVLFTARVSVTSPGTGPLTGGSVTFYNGSKIIGTVGASSSGAASISYTGLPVGSNSVRAIYSGNGNYESSRSNTVIQTVVAKLVIKTLSLPDGTINGYYHQFLSVSGGISSFTWSIISGALPTGLTLNPTTGAITGKPTVTGNFNFTVQVKDSQGNIATKILSIRIINSH